jgi:hypothetical protein
MKKVAIISLCLILIALTLSSCDPIMYSPTEKYLKDVVSIELIRYNNPDQKDFISWVPDHSDELVPFDCSKVTILETLPKDQHTNFTVAFSQTVVLHHYYKYDSPAGICIKATYSNGNFLIMSQDSSAGYIGEFSQDGNVVNFWGAFSSSHYYENLVNDFFTYQI